MDQNRADAPASQLQRALASASSSIRLRAALAAGSSPDPDFIDVLIAQCRTESDCYVRDMLTWALIRHDTDATLEQLRPELVSEIAQARSQALHTLSKIGDPRTWSCVTEAHLKDGDDEVARAAWRAAVELAPDGQRGQLAEALATQLDRGDREVQLSLSRAFVALGPDAEATIERAQTSARPGVRAHAIATQRMMEDPETGFGAAIEEARRAVALLGAPGVAK